MPIAFEEMESSPVERLLTSGFEATRRLKCAWADRLDLARELSGSAEWVEDELVVTPAATYPNFSAASVRSVQIAPFGVISADTVDASQAAYPCAILTVHYATPSSDSSGSSSASPDTLVAESLEPTTEFLTISADGLRWGSTSGTALLPDESPGQQMRGLNWVYTRFRMPVVVPATFSLVGKVNASSITSTTLGVSFAAETLLYNPPLLKRTTSLAGVSDWQVTYRFSYRPTGWNRFWRSSTSTFDQIFTASGPLTVYPTGDFTALLA